MPKVTVVIPAYNAMPYLPKTLSSVLTQTFTDFEVLIINDGSKDEIIEWSNLITDQRVKVISQENQGLSNARNTGIQNANGKFIALLDADDLWHSDKLEKQVNYLETHPEVGLVYTWVEMFYDDQTTRSKYLSPEVEGEALAEILIKNIVTCGSTPLIQQESFSQVGLFDEKLSSSADWDMWIRIASKYHFGVVRENLVYYRQHNKNMSRDIQKMFAEAEVVIEKGFDLAPQDLRDKKKEAYSNTCLYLAWTAFDNGYDKESREYHRKAINYFPDISKTVASKHLRKLHLAKRILGSSGYTITKNIYKNISKFQLVTHET